MNKQYLGDGVYIDNDGFYFILTTENGIEATNTIFLDPQVWNNLNMYVSKLYDSYENKEDSQDETS